MKKLNVLGFVLLLIFMVYGCDKDCNYKDEDYRMGIVLDSGSPAADGCGWLIKVDSIIHFPDNLDQQFHKDRLEVKLVFKDLNAEYKCGYLQTISHPTIHILKIKER